MKQEQIAGLENIIKKGYSNMAGMVIFKDGQSVYENYYNGYTKANRFHIFSVTKSIPITEKVLLTLEEAALLTGVGQNKLREISNGEDCPFVLWNGNKRMFKREKLIGYLCSAFSI